VIFCSWKRALHSLTSLIGKRGARERAQLF
jgi:hypothetical protein